MNAEGEMVKTFYPDNWAHGTYSIRARIVNTASGIATGWSPISQFALPST